jgi:hypothetical protein
MASTNLTLGTITGTNTVTATAANIGSVTFSELAIAGAPAKLVLAPATATTQTGVAVTYKATIQDIYGNTATTATNAHRSVRAELPHTALALGRHVKRSFG